MGVSVSKNHLAVPQPKKPAFADENVPQQENIPLPTVLNSQPVASSKEASNQEEKRQSAQRVKQRCRNRLSVTHADFQGFNAEDDAARGLICSLEGKALLDFLPVPKAPRARRWSLGSCTDADMHKRQSYADKSTVCEGVEGHVFSPEEHGIGYACKKGLKPVSPNQDSFLILHMDGNVAIYGVFDGHGKRGHDVSNFVKTNLPKVLVSHPKFWEDPLEALKDAYAKTQMLLEHVTRSGELDASASGTTTTVIISRAEGLYVSHVGDSRAVLAVQGRPVRDLTIDHKPEQPAERARIESKGGMVVKQPYDVNHRVYVRGERYPGLAMSRALGDLIGYYDAGISCEPSLAFYPKEDVPSALVLCSDGVWEFISSQSAADMVMSDVDEAPMAAAEILCKKSWDLWISEEQGQVVDDITAVVVKL